MVSVVSGLTFGIDFDVLSVEGTLVLLEESRRCKVSNFVYASSSSVYGNDLEIPFGELDATDKPISPYAATKKACEVMAYTYSHLYNLNCSGLRFFTVYGPRGRPDMAVFKFIDKIYNGETIHRYGDGTTKRDYTYIDDIVSGVIASLDTPRLYEVYNLGNGNPVRLSKMIEIIEKCMNIPAKIEVLPKQPGDVDMTYADISRAQELLGYEPRTSLEEGLQKTVEWYLNDYVSGGEHSVSDSDSSLTHSSSSASLNKLSSGEESC
jgi:UDP-glucuronate 4-epimerase